MMNFMQLFQMLRSGGNPQQLIYQMLNNSQIMQNPIMNNAMNMYQNGDNDGLKQLVENMAKERGTTIDEMKENIIKQLGR